MIGAENVSASWAHFWMWMIGLAVVTGCICTFMVVHKHFWKGWFGGPQWPGD